MINDYLGWCAFCPFGACTGKDSVGIYSPSSFIFMCRCVMEHKHMFRKRFGEREGNDETQETIEALQAPCCLEVCKTFIRGETKSIWNLRCLADVPKGTVPEQQRKLCLPEQAVVAAARSPGAAVVAAAPAGTRVVLSPWSLLGEAAGSGRPWCSLSAGQAAAGWARGTRGRRATRGCLLTIGDLSSSGRTALSCRLAAGQKAGEEDIGMMPAAGMWVSKTKIGSECEGGERSHSAPIHANLCEDIYKNGGN